MFSNYLKIAFRNLVKNKVYSFINIFGLAIGMAVATLIGLWIYDELTFNQNHSNYERIGQVWQRNTYNGQIEVQVSNPAFMADEIRNKYGNDFKYVLQSTWTQSHILAYGDKKFNKLGNNFEPQVIDMLSLKMLKGNKSSLKQINSIILSESLALAIFGNSDPMDKMIKLDNKETVKVTGIYDDLPQNSTFHEMTFVLTWDQYLARNPWILKAKGTDAWGSNFTQTFVQIDDNVDFEKVSSKIKNVKYNKVSEGEKKYKPEVFLHPMRKWHLYSDFKAGKNIGGRIEYVWLFGIIGAFVLFLACINFMNLSTARSEKRAKEVGIRKAIGSERWQLIFQFFAESLLVVTFSFVISIISVQFLLPIFNEVADKKLTILWTEPLFWLAGIGFTLFTGIIAGSYPALYLSSFQPVKVLKGTFRVGRFASIPRKVLVVMQFTVSITLIIGTIVVYSQIQYAKNRPIGYKQDGLISVMMLTKEIHTHFEAVRNELKTAGAIEEICETGSPLTQVWNTNGGFEWKGKDPNQAVDFPNNDVSYDYGKTVGWHFLQGRDFSRDFSTDSLAFVLNESAVKFIGFKNPIGETIKWNDKFFKVIGVIEDMVVESPYQPARAAMFHLAKDDGNIVVMKLNPKSSASASLAKIENIFKKFNPAQPFEYTFVDADFARKFGNEERIGKLSTYFAILAIFISCLGLFGLASFVAEQRTKEIGVRKVLGATVSNLWALLSRNFVLLVIISLLIASPIAYYFMDNWIQKYTFRTEISWWIFATTGLGALLITLFTVSYQAIKAALMNPVKSLRTE